MIRIAKISRPCWEAHVILVLTAHQQTNQSRINDSPYASMPKPRRPHLGRLPVAVIDKSMRILHRLPELRWPVPD